MDRGIQVSTHLLKIEDFHDFTRNNRLMSVMNSKVPWMIPTAAGAVLSTGLYLIFVAHLNYLLDVYKDVAASAIAANTVARSLCGAAAPLYTRQMFYALGIGGGGSLIGGFAVLLAIGPFVFLRYGSWLRSHSKHTRIVTN